MDAWETELPVQAGFVFIGILLLLGAGSVAGRYWRRSGRQPEAANRFSAQLYAWWAATMVLLCAFWFGHNGTTFLFFCLSFAALREFMTLVYGSRNDHNAVAACFYLVLPLQYYFVLTDWYGMFTMFVPVYAFLLLPVLTGAAGQCFFARTAKIQWGVMITVFCLSHVPALLTQPVKGFEGRNILLLIFMMLAVATADMCHSMFKNLYLEPALQQSAWVRICAGRRSLYVAAVLMSAAVAALLSWLTPFGAAVAALIGALTGAMALFGKTVMTAIKREQGVYSSGMLNRLAGICFAAPVFFHLVRYGWV